MGQREFHNLRPYKIDAHSTILGLENGIFDKARSPNQGRIVLLTAQIQRSGATVAPAAVAPEMTA
jgi:hypothetical protein